IQTVARSPASGRGALTVTVRAPAACGTPTRTTRPSLPGPPPRRCAHEAATSTMTTAIATRRIVTQGPPCPLRRILRAIVLVRTFDRGAQARRDQRVG